MIEEYDLKPAEINLYNINVSVQGYGGFSLNVQVEAKDPDEAFDMACGKEFRYQEDDLYVLMVLADDGEFSALCTYETLEEATLHVGTIVSGTWMLVKRDFDEEGGIVIESSISND